MKVVRLQPLEFIDFFALNFVRAVDVDAEPDDQLEETGPYGDLV